MYKKSSKIWDYENYRNELFLVIFWVGIMNLKFFKF